MFKNNIYNIYKVRLIYVNFLTRFYTYMAHIILVRPLHICYFYLTQCEFRISSRGWQGYLKGVAKISQGMAKKLRAIPLLSAFFAFLYNITNLRQLFFDILDTFYK